MLYKACLSSFALFAVALSPLAAATPAESANVVARHASSPSLVDKRESRIALAAQAKVAKARAARKAKRAAKLAAPAAPLQRRDAASDATAAINAMACPIRGVAGGSALCIAAYSRGNYKTKIPNSLTALCDDSTSKCYLVCNAGYRPTAAGCVLSAITCNGVKCPDDNPNGFWKYSCVSNQCHLDCTTSLGYQPVQAPGGTYCVNTNTDVNHCGGTARKNYCPFAYNGTIGERTCINGVCGLTCPAGFTFKTTSRGLRYCVPAPRGRVAVVRPTK